MTLRFTVPGRPVTNNLTARVMRGYARKNPAATLYQARVASIAMAAVRSAGWVWPPSCKVTLRLFGGLVDVDNAPKSVIDGMKGIVFPDDRRRFVRAVEVVADADGGEDCVEVAVEPCDPIPEIVRRKCHACLESRPGARAKPFVCGVCARRRKKMIA